MSIRKSKEKMDVNWLYLTEIVDVYDNRIIRNKEERLYFVWHDIYFVFLYSGIRFIEGILTAERKTPLTQANNNVCRSPMLAAAFKIISVLGGVYPNCLPGRYWQKFSATDKFSAVFLKYLTSCSRNRLTWREFFTLRCSRAVFLNLCETAAR